MTVPKFKMFVSLEAQIINSPQLCGERLNKQFKLTEQDL